MRGAAAAVSRLRAVAVRGSSSSQPSLSSSSLSSPLLAGRLPVHSATLSPWHRRYHGAVEAAAAGLQTLHAASGLPWWAFIPVSAAAIRAALLPITLRQLRATDGIFSAITQARAANPTLATSAALRQAYTIARKQHKHKRHGAHPLWTVGFLAQVPVLVLGTLAVRHLAAIDAPGFATEGVLWFRDLSMPAFGVTALILPGVVCTLFLTNTNLLFGKSPAKTKTLAWIVQKVYKRGLQALSVPIFCAGTALPQGVLLYWASHNALSLTQTLALRVPSVRQLACLPPLRKTASSPSAESSNLIRSKEDVLSADKRNKLRTIAQALRQETPQIAELLQLAAAKQAAGEFVEAEAVLTRVLAMDANHVSARYALGLLLVRRGERGEGARLLAAAAAGMGDEDEEGRERKASVMHRAAVAHAQAGDHAPAKGLLEEAARLRPADARILFSLASIHSQLHEYEDAKHVLLKAREIEPTVADVFLKQLEQRQSQQ